MGAEGSKTREQESRRSSTGRGSEVPGTTWGLGVTSGSLLQEHSTGGEGGQGLTGGFLPGAGQALGNGELLRVRERVREQMGNHGAQRPLCLGAGQSHSVIGSNVTNRLHRPLFKQMIVIDKRQ